MGITLQLEDGTLIAGGGGPYQTNADGDPVLSTNSVPSEVWEGRLSFTNIYRTQVWVAICVNFLTRQVARLPLKVYERDSQNVKRPVAKGPLVDLLRQPAERCGPIHLKQWMTMPTLVHGNGPVRVVRDRAGLAPRRFLPLDWRWLDPKETREGSGVLDYWVLSVPGQGRTILQPEDVMHIGWSPPAGVVGVSPLQQLGVTIRSERSAQRFQEASFRHSARPSGGISLPESVAGNRELRRELRRDLIRLHQGVDQTGKPIVMPPGAKWEAFSHSATEAQLIEVRNVNREEIAACYSAPQPLVGILDHATYSNVAELHKILYGPVLGPWLTLEEEIFKAQVIDQTPAFEGQWVEYELKEALRGDALKEAIALKTQIQTGLLTINEARQIVNLPPIDHPDCDRPLIPTNNLTPIGGTSPADAAAAVALRGNLQRLGARVYRRAKAGESDLWDRDRFERELAADLRKAHDHHADGNARTWGAVLEALIADSLEEPEQLQASFAALTPSTRNGDQPDA